jgi:hypothetical protein
MSDRPNPQLGEPYFRTDALPGEPQLFTGNGAGGWTPVPGSEKPSRWAAFTDDELAVLLLAVNDYNEWGDDPAEPEETLYREVLAEIERRKGEA